MPNFSQRIIVVKKYSTAARLGEFSKHVGRIKTMGVVFRTNGVVLRWFWRVVYSFLNFVPIPAYWPLVSGNLMR